MTNGFTILLILLFMKLMKKQVGIFNGIGMKVLNLQFMKKVIIMVGIQIKASTL